MVFVSFYCLSILLWNVLSGLESLGIFIRHLTVSVWCCQPCAIYLQMNTPYNSSISGTGHFPPSEEALINTNPICEDRPGMLWQPDMMTNSSCYEKPDVMTNLTCDDKLSMWWESGVITNLSCVDKPVMWWQTWHVMKNITWWQTQHLMTNLTCHVLFPDSPKEPWHGCIVSLLASMRLFWGWADGV